MEDLFRKQTGIISTRVGYTGGHTENPTYKDVCTGQTGHAEAIEVIFDQDKTSYRKVLEFFFQMHDPTTENRQGNDIGSQYRSAIFVTDDAQEETAQSLIQDINNAGFLDSPVVTTIEPAGPFYEAETYHQDYLEKNPGGYSCHFIRHKWAL